MNAPGAGIDQLGQSIDIGRQQLLHAAVFEHLAHDLVFVGEALQVLLLCRELLGARHLRLVRNAHLGEEHLAELACRVDVERRLVGQSAYPLFEPRQQLAQLDRVFGQRTGVDPHACRLHVGQSVDHGLLDAAVQVEHRGLRQLGIERMFEPQRDIGVLGGILGHTVEPYHIHSQPPRTLAYEGFDRYRRVVEVSLREVVHVMTRFGIEQIVHYHRVVLAAAHLDARAAQHHDVELHVLADLGHRFVLEKRAQQLS